MTYLRAAPCAIVSAALLAGCGVGNGAGEVRSDRLRLANCWDGPFDLGPDFFAGVPYRESYDIRIQRGDDIEEVSDGVAVLINDVHEIRGDNGQPSLLGVPLDVGLPPGVSPPGVPVTPDPSPPKVSMALYLRHTCFQTNSAVYAVGGVITFENLFNGDRNETNAEQKLTSAVFDVEMADPRDQPAGGGPIPEDKRSRVTGWFRFYFERGQPAQPFP
jgi:hypothetical protein